MLQIVFAILFGQIINFFNLIININVENIYIRLIICILSFFITACGVVFTITARIVPVAPDGLAHVISQKANIEFRKAKIYFDCVIVSLAAITLLTNGKGIEGLGIGTLLSALLVERIVGFINKNFKLRIEYIMFPAVVEYE